MKPPLRYMLGAAGAVLLLLLLAPAPTQGDTAAEVAATAALLDDLALQQTKLVENQAKMDEKIAQIAEEVRQARLFVARGGGKK